jgi:polysaccharide export outer membrane protein
VGDRIALTVEGPQAFADTAVVRDGLILQLGTFGDISLAGVKRSDIQPYLTKQIGKFIKDPVVHAIPLVRISILGEVGKPGFYTVPSDMLLSDIVMRAGGPTGNADLNKTVVKREGTEILSQQQAQAALANGETLDQLRIAPGDEIVVGQKSNFGFGTILQILGVAISFAGLLLALSYRHR